MASSRRASVMVTVRVWSAKLTMSSKCRPEPDRNGSDLYLDRRPVTPPRDHETLSGEKSWTCAS